MNTPAITRPALPVAVASLLQRLPRYPGSHLLVVAINLSLRPRLPSDVQQQMEGKSFRLCIRDASLSFDFSWSNGAFVACRKLAQPDLTIGASAHDFLLLAQRREDPDTLFFSRRLTMEGDTELGLLMKNTIDAVGPTFPDLSPLIPARLMSNFLTRPGAERSG